MNEIRVRVMKNDKDGYSYCVIHPLMRKIYKKQGKVARPIKRDDIGSLLGRLAHRILTQKRKARS